MGIDEDATNLTAKIDSADDRHCCGVPLGVDAKVWQVVG